jgi:hypothetical protein
MKKSIQPDHVCTEEFISVWATPWGRSHQHHDEGGNDVAVHLEEMVSGLGNSSAFKIKKLYSKCRQEVGTLLCQWQEDSLHLQERRAESLT